MRTHTGGLYRVKSIEPRKNLFSNNNYNVTILFTRAAGIKNWRERVHRALYTLMHYSRHLIIDLIRPKY